MNAREPTLKVFPVIHVTSREQALYDVTIVDRHPVNGVFLIDHDANDRRLIGCIRAVRSAFPDQFIGVNLIGRSYGQTLGILCRAFKKHIPVDAIWTDNSGLHIEKDAVGLRLIDSANRTPGWEGIHFGGVAYGRQQHVPLEQLPTLGALARAHIDIPTTSGPGPGQEADIERLRALRQGLGDHPFALVGGVTPYNIRRYIGIVDHILVSTGILDGAGGIDEQKLELLLDNAAQPANPPGVHRRSATIL